MDFDDYDSYAPIAPDPPPSAAPKSGRRVWLIVAVVAGFSALAFAMVPVTQPQDTATIASRATVPLPTPLPTETQTTIAQGIPAGEDTTVSRVIDGDTIEVAGGTRIRFIGIDAPETASAQACFGLEATTETRRMLPANQRVRLVYDVGRLDTFGRTLAYVYSLPDGRFVNLALAQAGFAVQATFPPNVAHVEDFRAAVAGARTAGRGLWAACPMTATTPSTAPLVVRGAVGSAPAPTKPPVTSPRVTTTPTTTGKYYPSCTAARADGAAPLRRGDAGYRLALDRDGDGVACE